jgi:hypothetical protein
MQERDPGSHPSRARVFVRQWNPFHAQVLKSFVQALHLKGNVVQSRTSARDESFHGTSSQWLQRLHGSLSHREDAFDESFARCLVVAVQTEHTFQLGFDAVLAIVRERNMMYPRHAPHHKG